MKKTIFRLVSLSVLIATGWFLYVSTAANASMLSCWEQAYNKWMSCDGAYLNTKYLYIGRNAYCQTQSATICSTIADTYCTTHATTSCAGDPNPQQCFSTTYNNCYLAQYQPCHTTEESECLAVLTENYDERATKYQECLGFFGNYNNCVEELEFSCVEAQNRSAACNIVYSDSDDGSAQSTCRANSGIDQCQ